MHRQQRGASWPAWVEGRARQREIPGWAEEMERRGVLLLGRPLELPQTAATVLVRDGQTLVSDGPFAEAKEWIAGFDLVECADLDEAIEVAAKGPLSWFKTIEIRPFTDGPWLGDKQPRSAAARTAPPAPICWPYGRTEPLRPRPASRR